MRVLLLASYCGNDNEKCTEELPCSNCLKMSNIIEIPDETPILNNYGGWDFNNIKRYQEKKDTEGRK